MTRNLAPLSLLTCGLTVGALGLPMVPTVANAACSVTADTLDDARRDYADRCVLARVDCDPVDGGWMCSSERIGRSAPGMAAAVPSRTGSGPAAVDPVPSTPPAASASVATPSVLSVPTSTSRRGGACAASASGLAQAKARYAESCSAPRVDCDAAGTGWTCASYRIGVSAPGAAGGVGSASAPVGAGATTLTPSGPVTVTPAPLASASSGTLRAEAESGRLSVGWESEGSYIVWRGTPDRYAFASRRDDANIAYTLRVPAAGRYRFTMRSAALEGSNPAEPPNDVWVRFGNVSWIKAYMNRDGDFHVGARGERGGRRGENLLESELPAGDVTVTISGRSTGHAIDWIALERVGGASPDPVASTSPSVGAGSGSTSGGISTASATGPYRDGDLLALHHDSMPDPDDLQAMIANRHVLDAVGAIDLVMVHGTIGHAYSRTIEGSAELARELFGRAVLDAKPRALWGTDRYADTAVDTAASLWQATLAAGDTVHVAEGGTSDFTALVLAELGARGVSNLEGVRVVQHSTGGGFNESGTRADRLALVKRAATWVPIDNGNHANATSDFAMRDATVERLARASRYAAQWDYALGRISSERRMDFSDTVELLHILGIPKASVPDVRSFAERYIK